MDAVEMLVVFAVDPDDVEGAGPAPPDEGEYHGTEGTPHGEGGGYHGGGA